MEPNSTCESCNPTPATLFDFVHRYSDLASKYNRSATSGIIGVTFDYSMQAGYLTFIFILYF